MHTRSATRRRRVLGRLGLAVALIAAPAMGAVAAPSAQAAPPVRGAVSSTTNPTVDGTGHCQNGNEAINCNIYDGKDYVWLTGLPTSAGVGAGKYFFAVLEPGGQYDPNDGGAGNLSTSDDHTNRTFTVGGDGAIGYTGTHAADFDNNKIRLMPYGDTTNPGGVYILATCSLAGGYPVAPSSCKYDAFKVKPGPSGTADPPAITKDAAGSATETYTWDITKVADKTLVQTTASKSTFTYTVNVSHDAGKITDIHVDGAITVTNFNKGSMWIAGVTDTLSDGTVCTVKNGGAQDLKPGKTTFDYSCELSGLPQGELDNTATVSWDAQTVDPDGVLEAGHAKFTLGGIDFSSTTVDDCIAVTDTYAGSLGTVCVGGPNPTKFVYQRTVPVAVDACASYDNTATFTTNTTGATGEASQSVQVCGAAMGLTMGFWQNKNGQGIITGGVATNKVCNSATWLRQFAPFQDLKETATCKDVGDYFVKAFNAANASGPSMNAMLKAQMLATALDVYFSDPSLGGNKIGSPLPLGGVKVDVSNASAAFGGATAMTVNQLLTHAAAQSNAGGSIWYGNVKAIQEAAKNTFDAINNSRALVAP